MTVFKRIKKAFFPWKTKPNSVIDWQKFLFAKSSEWQKYKDAAQSAPRVLIATSSAAHAAMAPVETALAVALTQRGANVHFLLCDQFLPTCWQALSIQFSNIAEFTNCGLSRTKCRKCYPRGRAIREPLGLPTHIYRELVTISEQEEADEVSRSIPFEMIPGHRVDGIAVGEHSLAGALRFFARGSLDGEPYAEEVLRRYFKSALLTHLVVRRLFETLDFDCALFYHGIYVPEGLIGEVARQKKVRVVNWLQAYRKRCFVFSHTDTYHHTLISEPVDKWENLSWNLQLESKLMNYLKTRWQGSEDWISFVHKNPQFDIETGNKMGLDYSKPCIGMLTNVMWDAQLHYPANAFPNMLDWVARTVDYFSRREELQLLIRVHPAEITGIVPSRQPIIAEINKLFPTLPKNVFIIPPESRLSTYAAMLKCDSVIIYGTKTGVELTSMGIPVIVAGEAWIRNKGVTIDVGTIDEYFRVLDRLPIQHRLDSNTRTRARKYAFHYFFRRMIPLTFLDVTKTWPFYRMALQTIDDLIPGKDLGLDVICDGILKGSDFIYPAEHETY
ncbi:MAG: hypothetical protein R6W95_16500 [Desulfosarcina sp.]|jgi:hypothetical protein